MNNDILIYLLLFLFILVLVGIGILIFVVSKNSLNQRYFIKDSLIQSRNETSQEMDQLKTKMMQDLVLFQTNIVNSMKGDFNQLNENTVNRLVNIETKVNESLLQGFDRTNKAFTNILEQMARIDETQQNLKSLSSNITSLQNVLTDKKTRGTYGEIELYSILESVFGNNEKRFSRQVKLSNGSIADCVIHAPLPLGEIVIDSKFPLENFNRMYDEDVSTQELIRVKNEFRKDVAKHIKDIKSKYLIQGETAEIAYMFIPAEAIFAEIYGHYDDLIQLSYESKVYLVSPTTLMAYITAIKAIYLGQERNDRVVEIQEEFIKLSKEFERFQERFLSVNRDFDKTYKDMQSVSITSDKIIKRFKQIESVQLDEEKPIHRLLGESEDGSEEN
ncbi:DNA recombination protein RmuC [Anaerorhabdus sp.]|uniref:DNA recombination protein RmuC n=1 Tax=Anaerorhabdus sp. TaxID=1872524 RepID=UPI002FCB15DE